MEHKKVLSDTAVILKNMQAKKRTQLPDEMMADVAGGYVERDGWAAGWEVVCPGCGASNYGDFDSWIESEDDCLDGYQCRHCKTTFGIDREGRIWGNV